MARQIDYRDKKGLKQRKEIENKIDAMSKYVAIKTFEAIIPDKTIKATAKSVRKMF